MLSSRKRRAIPILKIFMSVALLAGKRQKKRCKKQGEKYLERGKEKGTQNIFCISIIGSSEMLRGMRSRFNLLEKLKAMEGDNRSYFRSEERRVGKEC